MAALVLETYQEELLDLLEPLHAGHIDKNMIAELKSYAPDDWPQFLQQAVVTEQYYFALLWEKRFHDAHYYATDVIEKLLNLDIQSSKWHERAADAAFYAENYTDATEYYLSAYDIDSRAYSNLLKLADIYHINGDADLDALRHVHGV